MLYVYTCITFHHFFFILCVMVCNDISSRRHVKDMLQIIDKIKVVFKINLCPWTLILIFANNYGGCDQSADDSYSSMALDPTSSYFRCPILNTVRYHMP